MTEPSCSCYAYCVVPERHPTVAPGTVGVAGAGVIARDAGGLRLAISEVNPEDFNEAALRTHLEEPSWASSLAMAHYQVVDACFANGAVLPLRLCTVFSSVERAIAAIEDKHEVLQRALADVEDCAQWSVKVNALSDSTATTTADVSSGTDYLRRASERGHRRVEALEMSRAAAARLYQQLDAVALSAQQDAESTRLPRSASYLVRSADTTRFLATVRDYVEGTATLRVDIGGPWAPYSFVPDLGAAA
jgi:gas vesicle protein GvpL/GvpF